MQLISLSAFDLSIAAILIIALALLSFRLKLGLTQRILVAGLRTTIQLLLIGIILDAIFARVHPLWMALIATVMFTVAGREVMVRQKRRFIGWYGFGIGTLSMFLSSFTITVLALTIIIQIKPWYAPQYAIPLLGMLLGNTMNGVSIGLDRLSSSAFNDRTTIEARLMLGQTWAEAMQEIIKDSIAGGLIPIINSMTVVGLVSLPGMMTGQILSGSPPLEAVKYQILIMFLIAGGTGFGTVAAVWLGSRRLFDDRHRLRLDRLRKG